IIEKELRACLCQSVKEEFNRLNRIAVAAWEKRGRNNAMGDSCPPPTTLPVSSRLIGDVLQAVNGFALLPAAVQPPSLLSGNGASLARQVLACPNGLIHLPSIRSSPSVYLRQPTPDFFSRYCLDFRFDEFAPTPTAWLQFLHQLWPLEQHQSSIDTLQEWFGYCLLPDTSQHKILLLIGPPRSGKGTIARILSALLGLDNVTGPTLASLGSNFGLQDLIGKTLAIIS